MGTTKKYVLYCRVSTMKQGISGLGLEAQQAAAHAFVHDTAQVVEQYIEVESGKKNLRPQLQAAISSSQRLGATLLIAKLDRLSRNAGFIFALRDAGVDFVCCDMPDANTLTVGLFAVIAQHEREATSIRTTQALAAKKARGAKLGSPENLTKEAIIKGQIVRQQNALDNLQNRQATRVIISLHQQGFSLAAIVKELNEAGFRTRTCSSEKRR